MANEHDLKDILRKMQSLSRSYDPEEAQRLANDLLLHLVHVLARPDEHQLVMQITLAYRQIEQ